MIYVFDKIKTKNKIHIKRVKNYSIFVFYKGHSDKMNKSVIYTKWFLIRAGLH